LSKVRSIAEREFTTLPEGRIVVHRYKGRVYYYHRTSKKQKVGMYLKKTKSQKMIQELSQKEYCSNLIKLIDAETKAIRLYLEHCPDEWVEDVQRIIDPALNQFVSPIVEDDNAFLERWIKARYDQLKYSDYNGEITGEFNGFRSKSELIIANKLSKAGIRFKYEKLLRVDGIEMYPDFTLLDVVNRRELYWEHFGMMDDEVYVARTMKKMNLYSKAGLIQSGQMIITMESGSAPIDMEHVDIIISRLAKICCPEN